jgi:hypothetical protein
MVSRLSSVQHHILVASLEHWPITQGEVFAVILPRFRESAKGPRNVTPFSGSRTPTGLWPGISGVRCRCWRLQVRDPHESEFAHILTLEAGATYIP